MTEYGVLLADGTTAPASGPGAAAGYARRTGRELRARVDGGPWQPASRADVEAAIPRCTEPGWDTLWRHRRRGEPYCGGCRRWRKGSDVERARAAP